MNTFYDLIVVGAGPAGLAAACSAAQAGLKVLLLDEFMKPGGRLLGQLHQEPGGAWWNGIREAELLVLGARNAGAHIQTGVSVTGLNRTSDNSWTIWTNQGCYHAPFVLLATGAAESANPLPGWTLPGVMSIGAAQVMTNVQRVRVGNRGVVIGMSVLAMAIVSELRLAGINLAAIVLPPGNALSGNASDPEAVLGSLLRFADLAPSAMLKYGAKLLQSSMLRKLALTFFPKQGIRMLDVPLQLRRCAIEIVGRDAVEGVLIADVTARGEPIAGSERIVEADFVCIAGGLYPLAELAAVAGCPFRYVPELGGHVPVHGENMQTPLPGLYVAGNITGVESAKVAIAQGTVAGLSIAINAAAKKAPGEAEVKDAMAQVKRTRSEALIQFHPDIARSRAKLYQTEIV
ncbi:sarcosine oxidase subunit alpha [Paenibacillus endophyticus]|uniref:Sarcosine oxidase subunit alpha n=1 Tax=Paenibacillus endophyticus TaxID=1294268 RepID=A0A7W5CD76_9BACL|nr:FAD-dependent oxidoreductase [Paenibacillus endophyticus]MBB3154684.1 sarcosine oxidase subunit alpha [Paenibacillus endophyticus]